MENNIPGNKPARNKLPREVSVATPYRTNMMLGGIIGPISPPAAVIDRA